MAVRPSAQNHGHGRRLLDHAEQWARQHHADHLWLSTTPFLDAAIRLYRKAGFEAANIGPTELHGTPLIGMRKRLE